MQSRQSNSARFLLWHRVLLAGLLVLGAAACADRVERAMQYATQADQDLQAGNLAAARENITQALAERDDLPELYLLRGRIELAAEDYGSAYGAYANALTLDNTSIEALQAVSQLGLRSGNVRESLDATNRLLALQPDDPAALVTRGVHAFLQRRYPEAVDYAERAQVQRPDSEEPRILKSRALFMAGKPDEALAVVSDPSGIAPSAGIARTRLELYRELRDPKRMQQQFDILRRLAPDDLDLRIDEADLHFKLGAVSAAQAEIAALLARPKLKPDVARQAVRLFEAYDTTLPADGVARVAATGNATAKTELARLMIEDSRVGFAQELVRSLPEGAGRALFALLAAARGAPGEALQAADAVLETDETNCDALTAASQASLKLGRTLDALRHGQRAAAECPDRPSGWLANAAAYNQRRETANTERVYRDAIEANPQSLVLAAGLGDWLVARGRTREALAIGRMFTRKSPALLAGWTYYGALCARARDDCMAEADRGLSNARTLFGPDEETGKLPTGGLFGRLTRTPT